MRARLAFSTALEINPDIILVDEVLSVGDYAFQKKSAAVFQKIRESGKAIIFVSHDFKQLEEFCDRIILLDNGTIVKSGNPAEVIQSYISMMNKPKN